MEENQRLKEENEGITSTALLLLFLGILLAAFLLYVSVLASE